MSPVIISADPSVHEDSGKVAVMRGPVVYCAEGVDNGDIFSLAVSPNSMLSPSISDSAFPRSMLTEQESSERVLCMPGG